MTVPQTGIFALGNHAHTYLELDLAGADAVALVSAVTDLTEPRTTMGGVNLVSGFRPEVWRAAAPDRTPEDLHGFDQPVDGIEGFTMPATQHDLVLWIAGASYDVVFDAATEMIAFGCMWSTCLPGMKLWSGVSIEEARGLRLKVACVYMPTMSSSAGAFRPLSARAA